MKITDKILAAKLLIGQAAAAEKKAAERKIKSVESDIELIKGQFPMGGERIEVNGVIVATVNSPKQLTKLDKITLEAFLNKHGKTLADYETIEMSAPGWAWVAA